MKTIRLEIFVFVVLVLYTSSSSTDTGGLKTQLNGSQIQLHSFDTNLFLLVNTEEPIEKPQELIYAFNCSLSGRHLLEGPIDFKMSLLKYSLAGSSVGKGNITWDKENPVPHTYVLSLTSTESGCIKCQDALEIGLETKDVLHSAGRRASVLARYGVSSISEVVKALEGNNYFPLLISIDPDTPTDPEVTIRFESEDPFEEKNLRENAYALAREGNWSVKYVRGSTFCLSEETGGFNWPATKVGRRATPNDPCIDGNGTPSPSRRCLGSLFEGAYWENVKQREPCLIHSYPERSLLAVIQNDTADTLEYLDLALKARGRQIGAVEVHLISLALRVAERNMENSSLSCVVDILNSVLEAGKKRIEIVARTSSASETILDAIDQIIPRSDSKSSMLISKKHISAVSFHVGDTSSGFALVDGNTMKLLGKDETVDAILKLRPKVAVVRVKGINNSRMDYIVMKDDSLFSPLDLRRRAVGPVVGVGITQNLHEEEILTVLIAFKRDEKDPNELSCATWNPKTDEDWTIPTLSCSKGKSSKKYGSPQMDICLCNVVHNGFIFFTRIYEDKQFDFNKFFGSDVPKPKLELLYKERASEVVLSVYNRKALEHRAPILSSLECSVNGGLMNKYPLGLNPEKPLVLYNYTTVTYEFHKDMAIIKVSYGGDGYMTCRDRLGLGLVSNQIRLRGDQAAVVRCRMGPLENLDEFMIVYTFKYSKKFKMAVRIQNESISKREFVLRFSQSSEKNHTNFISNVRILSEVIARDYNWTVLYMRSSRYCPSVEEGDFEWPTILIGHPVVPWNPCVDSRGIPTPTRRCLGDYIDGSYWESAPKRLDPCSKPSDRIALLRNIINQQNKMDAIEQVSEVIEDGPSLNPYEISMMSRLLKDAADEVSYTDSKLQNVSSFATIVNSMQEAGRDVLRMADASTGSSYLVRESIDVLLATAASSTPTVISKPHFSALTASLDSDVRGFVQDKSVPIGKSMITLRGNTTIDEIVRSSPNVAAYFRTVDLQKGVITSTLFHDDSLFGAPPGGMLVNGPVVGMTLLSEVGEKFLEYDQPLELLLLFPRGASDPLKRTCQFWDPNEEGGWSGVGCELLPDDSIPGITDMDACVCIHTAYSAIIIALPTTAVDERDFYVVPIVGCSICLFSILMVLILITINPQYRSDVHKKVHCNYAISLVFLMISYLTISLYGLMAGTEGTNSCVTIGILNFSLLASFTWRFLSVILLVPNFEPYRRMIMGTRNLIRGYLIGWGIPMIIAIISSSDHTPLHSMHPKTALCYPEGSAFWRSVIVPVAIVIVINLIVFYKLARFIFFPGSGRSVDEPKPTRQFFSALLHFSLLFFVWVFGLAMTLTSGKTFIQLSRLFTAIAILQGSSMLILLVISDQGESMEGTQIPDNEGEPEERRFIDGHGEESQNN